MKFPTRTVAHVAETVSWRLLQYLAPEEWIVREVSERDYGIDAYIELVSKEGQITGQLMSVQLKGVNELNWQCSDSALRFARSPSVKTTTASYWLGLPVPVFLFVADLSAKNIYFSPVKDCIRSQFDELKSQETMSFKLVDKFDLHSTFGMTVFRWHYNREKMHDLFSFHMSNLISHARALEDFIKHNQDLDWFLEVDASRHLQFRSLYYSCWIASVFLRNEWEVVSLDDLYKRDHLDFIDCHSFLHEKTLNYALQQLGQLFPQLINEAIQLVVKRQASYWSDRDPVFFHLCSTLGLRP